MDVAFMADTAITADTATTVDTAFTGDMATMAEVPSEPTAVALTVDTQDTAEPTGEAASEAGTAGGTLHVAAATQEEHSTAAASMEAADIAEVASRRRWRSRGRRLPRRWRSRRWWSRRRGGHGGRR